MRHRLTTLLCVMTLLGGCGSDDAAKIGAVLPLTGEGGIYGVSIKKGIELAMTQLQADPAYPIELELMPIPDSQSDPERAARLADELYSAGAVIVIGGVTSGEALAMVEVADRHNRVLLSPSASTPELTGISTNFFRVFPSDFLGGTKMGSFAVRTLEIETVVILAKQQAYAKGVQQVFSSAFEREGGEVLELIEYPSGAFDVSGLVERVLALRPDAVYVAGYAEDIANLIESLRDGGYRGILLTTDAFAAPEVIQEVGEAADGIYLTQIVFNPRGDDPRVREFVEAYQAQYPGETPNLYAAHGYDAMMVVAEALEGEGRFASELWKDLRGLRGFRGVTGQVQFDEKGDVQKFPRVYVVDDGRLLDYEAEVEQRRQELLDRLRELRGQGAG